MTFILTYQSPATHVMLGDLLISRDSPRPNAIELPTRFDPNFPVNNLHLADMAQKVMCLSPHVAVAWAGNYLVARHVIRAVAAKQQEPFTETIFAETINTLGLTTTELDEIALLFWRIVPQGGVKYTIGGYDHRVKVVTNAESPMEIYRFAGSGDFHFWEILPTTLTVADERMIGSAPAELKALGAILGRASMALFQEVISDDTHDFHYGGGFEAVVPTDQGLQKVPLTFVFWVYDNEGLHLSGPVLSHTYAQDGVLGLRRFARKQGSWEQTIFPVRNFMHGSNLPAFDRDADIHTFWTTHYFVDGTDPGNVRVIMKWGGRPNLLVRYDGKEMRADVQSNFWNEMADIVKDPQARRIVL